MKLFKPELKNEKGDKEITSTFLGSSESWDLGLSFDYFINWSTKKLEETFYLKRCWNKEKPTIEEINKENDKELKELDKLKKNVFYILNFNEKEFSQDMEIYISKRENNLMKKETTTIPYTLNSLMKRIIRLSGREFKIGEKGLTWFTTELEKGLSKTNACYPGDCDCMILKDNKPVAILEFQKRTTEPETFLKKMMFEELYNGNQKVKYERLIMLAKQFQTKEIPLYILHYHTSNKVEKIALEKINLKTKKSMYVKEFPYLINKEKTLQSIKEFIINFS